MIVTTLRSCDNGTGQVGSGGSRGLSMGSMDPPFQRNVAMFLYVECSLFMYLNKARQT